jgi:hypothetical protein
MPTEAPKHRASERAGAEYLEPSDEQAEKASRAFLDFLDPIFRLAVDLRLFDYTDEQWADIERSLLHLQPDQAALEKARNELVQAARLHNWELIDDAFGRRNLEKCIAKEWVRIKKLSDDLLGALRRVGTFEGLDRPGRQPAVESYKDEQLAVARLNAMAVARLAGPKIDDGFPKATKRQWFHFHVLHVWTELGGKLRFSRHPTTQQIKGPLARYFAAATQPVCGGSLESLPDILKRQESLLPAVKQWVAKMRAPNGGSTAF